MEADPLYARYVSLRTNIYRQLDQIRADVDFLLAEMATRSPVMSELARLEAFHSERQRLLAEMQDAEERFLEHLLDRRGELSANDSASA